MRLCGLRLAALVGAEQSDFDAAVSRAVVAGLLIIQRLVFAESHDLDAVDGDILLPHEIGLDDLGAAAAEFKVVVGGTDLVGEALDSHKVGFQSADFGGSQFVKLLLAFIGKDGGIELEENRGFANGFVVIEVGYTVVELRAQVGADLIGFFGGGIRAADSVGGAMIGGSGLFISRADARLGGVELLLGVLLILVDFADPLVDRVDRLRDILFGGTTA